jgi:SAM-dependent methyltransferase
VRRFPSGINEKYICEKYFEDKWVSEGNNELARQLDSYIYNHLDVLKRKDRITLLDIGPCGGAITTLFALRALNKFGLLGKVNLALLDIVPNVLEATLLGKFNIPDELINEYGLEFLGHKGEKYKQFLGSGVLHDVREWYDLHPSNKPTAHTGGALFLSEKNRTNNARVHYYRGDGETLPKELNNIDIVLSAYTHHHMNLFGRQSLCRQMEQSACPGGFVGVADFYVPTYEAYMAWYKPHFQKYGDAPPVECPLIDGQTLVGWFAGTKINQTRELERTVAFSGVKQC